MAFASLRRIRRGWDWLRPFPSPRYVPRTPKIDEGQPSNVVQTPNTLTLGAAAMSKEAVDFVAVLIDRLTPSEEVLGQQSFYRLCQAQFGGYWRYADLHTALWAAANLIQPKSYLEIGVHRGRSAAIVGAMCPQCSIYGFDLWIPDYGGQANPGPDFVRGELRAVGHGGSVTLMTGDSRKTAPAFLSEHPDLYFDLMTVDGDHSALGAATDMANVLPRLKVGGIVVFDDICSVPVLRRVWDKLVRLDSRYLTWQFTDAGYGVAAAIRVGDEPLITTMRRW